jgi:hypothetical protein
MFGSLFSVSFLRSRPRPNPGRRRRARKDGGYRPELLALESRTLLSTWVNPAGGDWDNPENWSGGRVPSLFDEAIIPFHNIQITHNSAGFDGVRRLQSEAAIDVSAGELEINGNNDFSRIDDLFRVSGGALFLFNTNLVGSGSLTNSGTVFVGGDDSEGNSTVNVAVDNEGVLTLNASVINNDANHPFTNGPNATLGVVEGGSTLTNAFTNQGRLAIGGSLNFANSGTLVNAPGAHIDLGSSVFAPSLLHTDLDNQGTITGSGTIGRTGGTVTNEGTITAGLPGGGGVTIFQSAFTNRGTITIPHARSAFSILGGPLGQVGSIAGDGLLRLQGVTTTLTPQVANNVGSLSVLSSTVTTTAVLTNLVGISGSTITAPFVRIQQSLSVQSDTTINGTLQILAGVNLTIAGGTDQPARLTITHGLTNNGSIVLTDGGDLTSTVAELTVTGGTLLNQSGATITAAGGTIFGTGSPRLLNAALVNNGLVNIDQATFWTGSIVNGGGLNVRGGSLAVTLTGEHREFDNDRGVVTVASQRALTVLGGDFINGNINGDIARSGFVNLSPLGSLTVDGAFTQANGAVNLNGGTLTAGGLVEIQRGRLAGPGTINGNVRVDDSSEVDVGGPGFPGVLTINGDYTQTALAVLVVRLANTTPGLGFDQLNVTGQATLDGTLRVNLILGFMPNSGDSFTIFTFGSSTGAFAGFQGDVALFTVNFDANDVTLVAN